MDHDLKGGALTANPYYPVSAPSTAVGSTVPPVASWMESPMVICRWCGFMVQFGRGPVEHLDFCNICKNEVEVQSA